MIRPPRIHWTVEWFSNRHGFEVCVRDGYGGVIDHAARGNAKRDPLRTEPTDLPQVAIYTEAELRALAYLAAQEIAAEFRVPSTGIREVAVEGNVSC